MWSRLLAWLAAAPASEQVFEHPLLGTLQCRDDWWEGQFPGPRGPVDLTLDGDQAGPHPALLDCAAAQVRDIAELEAQLALFVQAPEVAAPPVQCRLVGLSFYAQPEPPGSQFVAWLELAHDAQALWQVLVVDGTPRRLRRDA